MDIILKNDFVQVGQSKPTKRTLFITAAQFGLHNERFYLSFPYVVYLWNEAYGEFLVCLANSSVKNNFEEKLYPPLLPNSHYDFTVCLGDDLPQKKLDIRYLANFYWQSGFYDDDEESEMVDKCYDVFAEIYNESSVTPDREDTPDLGGYYLWQKFSKDDSRSITDVNWWPRPKTLQELISGLEIKK